VRKLATPLILLGLSVVLMGAGVAESARPDVAAPRVFNDGGLTLQLTPAMPGVTVVNSTTLVCPVTFVTTSSGLDANACAFTISSTGTVPPEFVAVTMTASGITTAQVAAHKFAIEPNPGPLVYLGTTSQTIYTFSGGALPVTFNPAVAWGVYAGTALDNSDMGSTIVVTYTVVAEVAEGATATPAPSQNVAGATSNPVGTTTPPPTSSASGYFGGNGSSPLFALLTSLLLAGLGFELAAIGHLRRSVRR